MQRLNTRSVSLVLFLFGLLVGLCHAGGQGEDALKEELADVELEATAISPEGMLYIYGGKRISTGELYNKLISINLTSASGAPEEVWTSKPNEKSPEPRYNPNLSVSGVYLVMQGGRNDTCTFNGYWKFRLNNKTKGWEVILEDTPVCEPSADSSFASDSSSSSSTSSSSSPSSSSASDSSSTSDSSSFSSASSASSNTASSSASSSSSTSYSSSTASSSSGKNGGSSPSSDKSGESSSSSSASSNASSSEAKDSSSKSEDGEGMTGPKIWRTGPSPAMWAVFSLGIVALSVLVAFYVWREWRRNSRTSYSVVNRF